LIIGNFLLASENPVCKEIIRELSKKWAERTKKLATKWPVEGAFNVAMCREMKVLIKNHKTNDKSKNEMTEGNKNWGC
jgi:hypothetical protein